ncbi:transcriptional regulator [Actinoplanes cyaneus]|jgi:DNA-binding IclR family transcriptional regulator|uniref:Transcriptional regulator n=1 Tax=Actinoplanes cyaneus TaxID=52696 RepID=A0A919IKF6_9ACTN|nr:IclR family transcriptional regulator [Actinoplanes cyaneus]MCW2137726.1 transcriptional regulator, IclR family [Actinoplanes cyaneus]GID65068.1 transcriptional regulator [Actinoplanes cyaneus]
MRGKGAGLLQSVERAMRVLDHVAAAAGPVPARDVAAALGLTLPTTYHLLTTLVESGYLVHLSELKAYALGHRVDDLARGLHRQIAAPPEIRRVAAVVHRQAHAPAYYAALRNAEMIVAHVDECPDHPRVPVLGVGFHEAPHATAFGKLMLATLNPADREELLDRHGTPAVTPATVTDRSQLLRQLHQVRGAGLAVEVNEFQPDLSCLAAPVNDAAGRFVGAVAVSLPTPRLRADRRTVERVVRLGGVRASRAMALRRALHTGSASPL